MSVINNSKQWSDLVEAASGSYRSGLNRLASQGDQVVRFLQKHSLPGLEQFMTHREHDNHAGNLRVVRRRSGLFQKRYHLIKRLFDLLLTIAAIPILLPLLGLLCLAIWLEDRGNPFFVQPRFGKGGRPFNMLKLRTMVPDAPQKLAEIRHFNEAQWPAFKMKNDPRITRVGRFLRTTSLDELPQLINVLKGEMSLVGPRPNSFAPATYDLWQHERLEVLPGMTGLWQVSGRSDLTFEDWVLLDISYIEQQSLLFDLNILWRTVESVLRRRGAY